MRLLSIFLSLCAVAAPALAQTANQFAVMVRTKATSTQEWADPVNPNDVTRISSRKATEVDYIIRNLNGGTETVIRLMLLPRLAPATGLQRVYKVNTTAPGVFSTVVFGTVPQDGVLVPEIDTIGINQVSSPLNLLQRAPQSTVANPINYLFEIRRFTEPTGGTPNPILTQTQFYSGLESRNFLKKSIQTITFPKKMAGSLTRWEKRTYGVTPWRTDRPAKAILLTTGTYSVVTDLSLMDQILDTDYVLPLEVNTEGLPRGQNPYATRIVTYHLERLGYVNYDKRTP